ncbi:MAG TPA: glutathione transferase GstA [Sedimenticola sp.]|nr:glutathione transferase GstA [Sedimenticola sp.]
MKLYYAPGACSLAPHIVLCETGLPCELILVDLEGKRTDTGEDFLQINPLGYVPALQLDDGSILLEGPAIVQFLADQAPHSRLVPAPDTFERYRLQQWLNFIATELHQNCGTLFHPELNAEATAWFQQRLNRRLAYVAEQLQDRDFLLNGDFTVADAYLFVVLSWRDFVGFDLAPWPVLSAYFDRILARPSVQEALRQEGLID